MATPAGWLTFDRPNRSHYAIAYPPEWYLSDGFDGQRVAMLTNFDPAPIPNSLAPHYRPDDGQAIVVFQLGYDGRSDRWVADAIARIDGVPVVIRDHVTRAGALADLPVIEALIPSDDAGSPWFFQITMYPADARFRPKFVQMLKTIRVYRLVER